MATPQLGTTLRNDMAGNIVTAAAGGTIKFFSGALPANCAAADPSGELASATLPSPALTASGGVCSMAGTWTFTGSGTGVAACGRLYTAAAVCFFQGPVTATGGGGVFELNDTTINPTQTGTVTSVTITVGGA